MCDAFNHHLIASGHLYDSLTNNLAPVVPAPGPASIPYPPTSSFSLRSVSQAEVLNALTHLNLKKSKGEDNLDPYLLHASGQIIASPLTHIFNLTFTSGKIPAVWKAAQVIPLLKGGSPSDLNNYRPISKLCCLAKILESIVNSQLRVFLDSQNISIRLQTRS